MARPDFISIGHVVKDLASGGWRLGGTATYSALQALRLGLEVGIVTHAAPEAALERTLPGIEISGRASVSTTTFENTYEGDQRRQRVPMQAEPLTEAEIPATWRRTSIVHIGPVLGEMPASMSSAFPHSLAGVSAQGWLRRLDGEQRVQQSAWTGPPFWTGCQVLFVSEEDLGQSTDQLPRWTTEVPIVVFTKGDQGADVHDMNEWRRIDAFPARGLDPTGAGDVFAAAFLIRYHETDEAAEAARFAAAAAACSVEASGLGGVADRGQIEARMADHPEIALR